MPACSFLMLLPSFSCCWRFRLPAFLVRLMTRKAQVNRRQRRQGQFDGLIHTVHGNILGGKNAFIEDVRPAEGFGIAVKDFDVVALTGTPMRYEWRTTGVKLQRTTVESASSFPVRKKAMALLSLSSQLIQEKPDQSQSSSHNSGWST